MERPGHLETVPRDDGPSNVSRTLVVANKMKFVDEVCDYPHLAKRVDQRAEAPRQLRAGSTLFRGSDTSFLQKRENGKGAVS